MNSSEQKQIVVANSFDVSTGRLSNEAMTLEEHRRLGGVIVKKEADATVGVETVTGGLNSPSFHGAGGFTTRANHAVIIDQQ